MINILNVITKGASAGLLCPTTTNFNQSEICSFNIASNMGNYSVTINYGDTNSLTRYMTDGTISTNHVYSLYGSYVTSVTIPLISATYSKNITVTMGNVIFHK